MARAALRTAVVGCLVLSALAGTASAAPQDPIVLVRAWWDAADAGARASAAARVAAHKDYRPARLREWLHKAVAFPALTPGSHTMTVDVGGGQQRRIFLIVPEGYRPDRAWPLIYALHPSGEPADRWAEQVHRMLGRRGADFVVASPEYFKNYLIEAPPYIPEHQALIDAVARQVHVNADRVYPFGYSRGGFGAWYAALYYPHRFAGMVCMAAGFDVAPADDGLWTHLVRNVAHLPVLNTWGERDPLIIRDIGDNPVGTFAESNRRFARELQGMDLPITNLEVPGGVHNQLAPPGPAIVTIITGVRQDDPKRLTHVFRHLHQAGSYWLEGLSWVGERWGDDLIPPLPAGSQPAARDAAALAKQIEPLLGRMTGERDGQVIRVTRRHIGDVVVWLGEQTIDWGKPVTIEVDGRSAFTGRVTPDAAVALARAKATMDFEQLRFAGIRIDADGRATVLTEATMPEPVWKTAR